MIQEFIIRTDGENTKVIKAIVKSCKETAKKYDAEFYSKVISQKNPKYLNLTSIPKDQKEQFFEGRRIHASN